MRRGWADFEDAHKYWTIYVSIGSTFGESLPSNRYFELRYEDLIGDEIDVARVLFDFLEIPFHPRVEQFCRAQQAERTPFNSPTRDIADSAAPSDWQRLLDPGEKRRSLELLGELLVRYGYETPSSLNQLETSLATESGWHAKGLLAEAVGSVVPSKATLLLVSGGDERLLLTLSQRRVWHFPQTGENVYSSSLPLDSDAAIAHLEDLRARGGDYLIFPSAERWWLDYYADFRHHLDNVYEREWDDNVCVIYRLSPRAKTE
jgi:hypothetical protein